MGTGTSQGIPVIGCDCAVCISTDPRDTRLRTAILISIGEKNIVVDVGPDFRQQMLNAKVDNIEAVLITHEHNDHIIGLDDVRPFNFRHHKSIPILATESVQNDLRQRFAYAFAAAPYPGAPRLELLTIHKNHPFYLVGEKIIPIEIMHGSLPILGFRVRDFTYLTDMNDISEVEFKKLAGTKILVLDALHHTTHHSHFNLEEAIAFAKRVNAERTYLIHLSHMMGTHAHTLEQLPKNIEVAYDGLVLSIN